MYNIFISYSRDDQDISHTVASHLDQMGNTVWLDKELKGGEDWWNQILDQIRNTDIFIFVLSQKSLDSTPCKRELGYADALEKPILPIKVQKNISSNLLPPALSKIQFVDYMNLEISDVLSLVKAINNIKLSDKLPEELPTPPKIPVSQLGNLTQKISKTSAMDFEEQKSVVFDLKKYYNDIDTRKDAHILFKKLKERTDLLAVILQDIDTTINQFKDNNSEENKGFLHINTLFPNKKTVPKFCRKCGNRLEEDEYVCLKCNQSTV